MMEPRPSRPITAATSATGAQCGNSSIVAVWMLIVLLLLLYKNTGRDGYFQWPSRIASMLTFTMPKIMPSELRVPLRLKHHALE
jgi:hypothetical protein